MLKPRLTFLLILVLTVLSCNKTPNYDEIKDEILALHRSFIQAHLDKDAAYVAKPISPDYIFVSNGDVQRITPQEMEENLRNYLNSTEFTEYYDIDNPIIGVSKDGSLAWAIAKVRTAASKKVSKEIVSTYDIQWAWITLYENIDGQWIRIAEVSTNREYHSED